jgi:hypothetical protein
LRREFDLRLQSLFRSLAHVAPPVAEPEKFSVLSQMLVRYFWHDGIRLIAGRVANRFGDRNCPASSGRKAAHRCRAMPLFFLLPQEESSILSHYDRSRGL